MPLNTNDDDDDDGGGNDDDDGDDHRNIKRDSKKFSKYLSITMVMMIMTFICFGDASFIIAIQPLLLVMIWRTILCVGQNDHPRFMSAGNLLQTGRY